PHGRVVLDGRDAQAHLAVEEDSVGPELAVGALLPTWPDLAEADPHATVHDGRALDHDAGARVRQARALGQVLPGGTGLVRVVGRWFGELLDLDALLAPGGGGAGDGRQDEQGGAGEERALVRTHGLECTAGAPPDRSW